jgi:hypothetical protein
MKSLNLLAALGLGCCLVTSVQAAKQAPAKRQLATPVIVACSDALTVSGTVTVADMGQFVAENANVEWEAPFAGTVYYTKTVGEVLEVDDLGDPVLYPATFSGATEESMSIVLTHDPLSSQSTGTFSFDMAEHDAAVLAAAMAAVPAAEVILVDEIEVSVTYTFDSYDHADTAIVEAKAWTTSNSVQDSKPAQVPVTDCVTVD